MRVGEHREDLIWRVRLLGRIAVIALVVVGSFFWFEQIVRGNYYSELAENNRLRKLPIKAPRGLIYDRAGRLLVENVPSYNLQLDRSRTNSVDASLAFAATALEKPLAELRTTLTRYKTTAAYAPVLLAENLTLSQVARFGVASLEHPEFDVEVGHLRLYRHSDQTAHVLGYLGEASEHDVVPGGTVLSGEMLGKKGVEARYDAELRGKNGARVVVVDSRGRLLEEKRSQQAQPGSSLTLTLDLDLQQTAERAMGDRVGAVVALDPRNGEILALVSTPSYDPNLFARRLQVDDWQRILNAPNNPLQNRVLQNTYSPGSVFKIIVAIAGLSEHVIAPEDSVVCNGVMNFYDHPFRCWKKEGHGRVNLRDALRGSCDIYFYQLGQRLGIERIARYARLFGLSLPTGIDIGGEKNGLVPDPRWSLKARGTPWYPGETISVAIGQGPLLVTPVQMAAMMAAVANGGLRVTPHIVKDAAVPPPQQLEVEPGALRTIRDALWAVVNDDGTGKEARVPGVDVAGKTSTVQVIGQKSWLDSMTLPFEQRDHAWFASFAPAFDPKLVVVVFVEHGGKGSHVAAPVARALYENFFHVRPADESPDVLAAIAAQNDR